MEAAKERANGKREAMVKETITEMEGLRNHLLSMEGRRFRMIIAETLEWRTVGRSLRSKRKPQEKEGKRHK